MPITCVVPNCKGKYMSVPRVPALYIPKDEGLSRKWVRAIKMESFTPSKNSRVSCSSTN